MDACDDLGTWCAALGHARALRHARALSRMRPCSHLISRPPRTQQVADSSISSCSRAGARMIHDHVGRPAWNIFYTRTTPAKIGSIERTYGAFGTRLEPSTLTLSRSKYRFSYPCSQHHILLVLRGSLSTTCSSTRPPLSRPEPSAQPRRWAQACRGAYAGP